MEWYVTIFFSIHLPSMAIYYFTNSNWPLAFKLQTSYFIVLTISFIIFFFNWKIKYGPKSLRPNNAAMDIFIAIFAIIIFLFSVAPVGGIALYYQDVPIGEPGILKPYIKWGLISISSIVILTVSYFTITKKP